MVSEKEPKYPQQAPAAGPSPEGSPVFFGVTMPRRWPQGWRLWGIADLDDPIDFDEYLKTIMDVYVSDSSEDEFDEFTEHLDNQYW
jgi:hypothetical protein